MTIPDNDTLLDFSRFEFKYVLSAARRKAVEEDLVYFMRLDPFVMQSEKQRYRVRSLYFDDPANTAFYDKIDGLKTRSKFRLRTYTRVSDRQVPIFLEEKGRVDNRVFKTRLPLRDNPDVNLRNLLGSDEYDDEPLVQQFRYGWFRKNIRPVAVIDYLRRPYVSKYDHEFRVTFDEQLYAIETSRLFPAASSRTKKLLPGFTIMEVKFNRLVPAWFHRIVQSYDLRREPMSKICEGMKALGIAVDL